MLLRFCLVAIVMTLFTVPCSAFGDQPRVWRLAYLEGGAFADYQNIFRGMILGMKEKGLIENAAMPAPSDPESTRPMWDWLAKNAGGSVQFLEDGHYSSNWDSSMREKNAEALKKRIKERGDVDIVLAFGTWSGLDMSRADLPVPVLVISVTNPVEAGIIPSADDSGKDNLFAVIEEGRHKRQLQIFHDIFAFRKLGIVYEDTADGRSSVALNEIEQAAAERDFELIRCTDVFDVPDEDLASRRLSVCHDKLLTQGVDAVYLTYNVGMQPDKVPSLLAPFAKAGIPTFSQTGSSEVRRGALLSIAQTDYTEQGIFAAEALYDILHGVSPRAISQRFITGVSLAVNLRMATLIGWNPALDVLAAVDEFYQSM